MLKQILIATAAFGPIAAGNDVTRSPPMVKGTALPLDAGDALPARVAAEPPPTLTPLAAAETSGALGAPASCAFIAASGTTLIAGADRRAFARPDTAPTTLLYEGPSLRLGGYFTAGDLTIVIEPETASAHQGAGGSTEWNAAMVVDRAGRNVRTAGTWRCAG